MVHIIQENRSPSFGQRFSNAVGAGLQGGSQLMQQYKDSKMNDQAVEAGKQLLGMDLSGFDPETRKALLVEGMKQQGKTQNLQNKQEYLDKLFGGSNSQSQPQSFQGNVSQSENQQQEIPSIESITGNLLPNNFNASKITDEDIARASSIDPNLGRALGHAKDVALRENREGIKADTEEKNRIRKEEIAFHKESQKYDEDLSEKARRAKNQIETFSDIQKSIDSGNVKPSSWTNIFRNFGETGNRLANAVMNKDEATLLSSIPQLLEGWKQVFGVRLTDADLRVLQDKLPDIGKSPEANKSILKVMRKYGDMASLRSKIASDIKKKNKGIRPLGYSDLVEERFDEMTKQVRVVNPNTGNVIEIPAYKVSDALNAGASLADE